MQFEIRKKNKEDKNEVLSMMKEFYSSDAVFTNGSEEIFENDFKNCTIENPYLEGYIFFDNSKILGYSMIAKSFSTEFGKPCIWIEDVYIKKEYRGRKIGFKFIEYIKKLYPNTVLRLESEKENICALSLYEKLGFIRLPYAELKYE